MIILEYIEEIWQHNFLLPSDPYDKAIARFWIKFAEDKVNLLAFRHGFAAYFLNFNFIN
ncbi:hypothetical protein CRYUN_Cryun36dG0045300 [Craigia yunnanensis]